jgi:hypothetical protein
MYFTLDGGYGGGSRHRTVEDARRQAEELKRMGYGKKRHRYT